jgi:hypothetical protein
MMVGSTGRPAGRLALVVVGLSTIAAASPIKPGPSSISFRIVAEGPDSRIDAHRELIIRMPGVWDFVWRKHSNSTPPEIDFRRETVIAIFGGRRANATPALRIASISEEDGSIVVRYREVTDQTGRAGLPTTPFIIVAIPPQRAPLKFVKEERTAPLELDAHATEK